MLLFEYRLSWRVGFARSLRFAAVFKGAIYVRKENEYRFGGLGNC